MKENLRRQEKAADECSKRINKRIAEFMKALEEELESDDVMAFDEIEKLRDEVAEDIVQTLWSIARDAYLRALWDAQKRWMFFAIDDDADIVDGVFSGLQVLKSLVHKNFDLWMEKLQAVNRMNLSPAEKKLIVKSVTGEFGESGLTYNLMRILRTETNREVNLAARKASTQCHLTGYIYHAILDDKLCERCKKLDGRLFVWAKAQVGVNLPPLHPNCRCYTENAGAVLHDMGYAPWLRKYVKQPKK